MHSLAMTLLLFLTLLFFFLIRLVETRVLGQPQEKTNAGRWRETEGRP